MKKQITVIKGNVVGAIIGAVALFYVAKKVGHVSNKTALVAVALIGVVAGAHAQSSIAARSGANKSAAMAKK